MTELDQSRIRFCARIFRAFDVSLTLLADHRLVYQVGDHLQCDNLDALERKAEEMLRYRRKKNETKRTFNKKSDC